MQITTVTFFRFHGKQAFWMLSQMKRALPALNRVGGLSFFKLLGSGGDNGFSIKPNFNAYALLCVWDSEVQAETFFKLPSPYSEFEARASEVWTVFMHNLKAHGVWSGQSPFSDFQEDQGGLIAVITRATVKWNYLYRFWSYVPTVSDNLKGHEGLLFSVGIGEYPLFMQATFSVWENRAFMQQYAYKSPLHREVIKKTRELGWYKEELFANFIPFKSISS